MKRRLFWLWACCFVGMVCSAFAGYPPGFWIGFAGYCFLSATAFGRLVRLSR